MVDLIATIVDGAVTANINGNDLIASQVVIATTSAANAQGYATALEVATAGGWYDSLAAGAADTAVAEGDGYFYLTGGRFYIGQKVSGVGVQQAEFLTSVTGLSAIIAGTGLAPLAALTPAADKLPYYSGAGTAALADLTAAARTLLAASTAAAQRTAIGAVIGTDVQAYDSDLAAIAALTTTSFGRSLLALADAAAGRTALAANGALSFGSNANGDYIAIPIGARTYYLQTGTATSGANGWSADLTLPVAYTTSGKIWVSATALNTTATDGDSLAATLVGLDKYKVGSNDIATAVNWISWGY